MLSFPLFDQWHSVVGFTTVALFLGIYPLIGNTRVFKAILGFGLVLAILAPHLVATTNDKEAERLVMRTAKIIDLGSFILLFYCFEHQTLLRERLPAFFWFCYALAAFGLVEMLMVDVLFSQKYLFVNTLYPWLSTNFGIQDFNFTAPLNYLIKFIGVGLLYKSVFKAPKLQMIFGYLIWGLVAFELVRIFIFKSYQSYDSWSSTAKNLFFISGAGLLLFRLSQSPSTSLGLFKNSYFWISIGLLLPALAELFLEFVFSKLYATDALEFYQFYLLRNTSQMLFFALLTMGVWQAKYLKFVEKQY